MMVAVTAASTLPASAVLVVVSSTALAAAVPAPRLSLRLAIPAAPLLTSVSALLPVSLGVVLPLLAAGLVSLIPAWRKRLDVPASTGVVLPLPSAGLIPLVPASRLCLRLAIRATVAGTPGSTLARDRTALAS